MASFSLTTQLDFLDQVALAFLQAGGEVMEAENKSLKTTDHSLRCVAVADANNVLLVAANNFFVTKDVIQAVARKKNPPKATSWAKVKNSINKGDPIAADRSGLFDIYADTSADMRENWGFDRTIFVTGVHTYLNNYHAEMQIIQFMLEHHIVPARRYMGVSKPCCVECTTILKAADFAFAESHASNVGAVRNVIANGFGHPHLDLGSLAHRLGGAARGAQRGVKGSYEARF